MDHILISGLKHEGPGDILGAIAGETNVDPQLIGNIEMDGSKALVEVNDEKGDKVVAQLHGKHVGKSNVSVKSISGDNFEAIERLHSYIETFERWVEMERQEEMREHEESIRRLSAQQRQSEGKAILHVRGRDEGSALEGKLVKFMRQYKGEALPETEISVGDLVMISRRDPLLDDNPTGTVVEKTNYSMTVAFENPRSFIFGKGLRMDLYVNDIPYRRMKNALRQLWEANDELSVLRDIMIGIEDAEVSERKEIESWFNDELNESQKEAVQYCVGAEQFHLVHGPPGTGKTTTIIEVIQQAVANGQKVLATAASNTAVDNILEFLLKRGVEAVRVGHPARVTNRLKNHTLDSLIEQNEKYRRSEELRKRAFEKKDRQDDYTHPSGRYRRGMSNSKIKELAAQGRASRGVPADKIQEMASWIEIREEVNKLFEKADDLRDKAVNEVLEDKQVICSTNSTAGSDLMANRTFELVVVDEATQATEPSCLIPITHGEKVVMAGDHKQLPPTVKNRKAAKEGLQDTLFERIAEEYPDITTMLQQQYRMHEQIMEFSNREFYEDSLKAHESVKEHTLEDLSPDIDSFDDQLVDVLDPGEPIVFVDTAGGQASERSRQGSTSKENPEEALLVCQITDNLLRAGITPEEIAVISPYKDQVDLLDRKIDVDGLEVKSVDGFQGREKEVVIISLCRSNKRKEIGFLEDVRRLNVSLTRAKRKLIVVGDSDTITGHETYAHFVDYVQQNGRIVEV